MRNFFLEGATDILKLQPEENILLGFKEKCSLFDPSGSTNKFVVTKVLHRPWDKGIANFFLGPGHIIPGYSTVHAKGCRNYTCKVSIAKLHHGKCRNIFIFRPFCCIFLIIRIENMQVIIQQKCLRYYPWWTDV